MLTPTQIVYVTGEVIVAVISIVGNSLVLAAIIKNKRLHTVTNVFIASLAIADIVVGFLAVPSATLSFLGLPQDFYGCVFINSVILMFTNISILMLMSVAIERFLAIKEPFLYQRVLTTRRSIFFNIFVWLLGSILGLIPMYGWNKGYHELEACRFTGVITYEYMVYFQFFGLVLIPLFIMFCIYIYILIIVRRHLRKTNAIQNLFHQNNRSNEGFNKDVKAAKMFALVILLFGICWLPVNIFNCVSLFCPVDCTFPTEALLAAIVMSHANSCINPFLYAASNSRIKQGIKSLFGVRFGQDDRSSTEFNHGNPANGVSHARAANPGTIHRDPANVSDNRSRFTVAQDDIRVHNGKKNAVVPIDDSKDSALNKNISHTQTGLLLRTNVLDAGVNQLTQEDQQMNGVSESQQVHKPITPSLKLTHDEEGQRKNFTAMSVHFPKNPSGKVDDSNYNVKNESVLPESDMSRNNPDHYDHQRSNGHSNPAFENDNLVVEVIPIIADTDSDNVMALATHSEPAESDTNSKPLEVTHRNSGCWTPADSKHAESGVSHATAQSELNISEKEQRQKTMSKEDSAQLDPISDKCQGHINKRLSGSITSNTTVSSTCDQKANSLDDLELTELNDEDSTPATDNFPQNKLGSNQNDTQRNHYQESPVPQLDVDIHGTRRNDVTQHTKL